VTESIFYFITLRLYSHAGTSTTYISFHQLRSNIPVVAIENGR